MGGNVLALALLATVGYAAPAVSQTGVRIQNGIVYATTESVSLKLDAYLPTAPGPHPGVIVIHGGGWYTGIRGWDRELGVGLAQAGFVAFGVDYRLAPAFTYPAPVEDVQTAVRWIRAHGSEFGVDPGRLGAIGESAGGHLAALLAVLGSGARDTGSRIAAAVSLSGPMDLGRLVTDVGATRLRNGITGREAIEQFLGCHGAACARPLREASPLAHGSARPRPFDRGPGKRARRLLSPGAGPRLWGHRPGGMHCVPPREAQPDPGPGAIGASQRPSRFRRVVPRARRRVLHRFPCRARVPHSWGPRATSSPAGSAGTSAVGGIGN